MLLARAYGCRNRMAAVKPAQLHGSARESVKPRDSSGSAALAFIVPAAAVAGCVISTAKPPNKPNQPTALTDMPAVRFGADQAHFGQPLKMRPLSDSCAEPQIPSELRASSIGRFRSDN